MVVPQSGDFMISIPQILRAISDDESLELFKLISLSDQRTDTDSLNAKLKLTRKQYYSRLSDLTNTGLVKRRKGKYSLTSFGEVVYSTEKVLEAALGSYWRLKAIDSLQEWQQEEEWNRIVDTLIDNYQLKEIILSSRLKYRSAAEKYN
jgi:DNA-binding transcriptional ArsR family regulator